MLIDGLIFSGISIALSVLLWLWLNGPAKLATFVVMCFSDPVNMLNISAAVIAFNLTIISQISEFAKVVTPIVILVSALVVLAYNVLKFLNELKNQDEE